MIHTRSLTKDFVVSRSETVHAVRGIDLDIAPGELVAFGQVIPDDTPDALKTHLAGDRITLTTTEADTDAGGHLGRLVFRLDSARDVTVDGLKVTARVSDGPRSLPELLHAARETGIDVAIADVDRPTLDDVFLTLTGRSLRDSTNTRLDESIQPYLSGKDAA